MTYICSISKQNKPPFALPRSKPNPPSSSLFRTDNSLGLINRLLRRLRGHGNALLSVFLKRLLPSSEAVLTVSIHVRVIPSPNCGLSAPFGSGVYVLPVIKIAISLCELCGEIDDVAAEEEVVFGCYGEGVAHEDAGVAG